MKDNTFIKNNDNSIFSQAPNLPFYIGRITDQKPSDMQLYHFHDCYEIYYLYSGERYYFIQDKTYHVTGGSIILINPYEIHCTGNLGNYGYDRMLIHFSKDLISNYIYIDSSLNPYKYLNNGIHIISLKPNEQQFIETLLSTMEGEYNKNHFKENGNIKISLIQLLTFINKCNPTINDIPLNKLNSIQKTIFEIVGYINNNYQQDLSLEAISNKYYLSTFYLSRTFKEITGFNYNEYINNVRIKEAKKLLTNSNNTIEEISILSGFKSNTHFGRVFKSIVGVTPSAYKKTNNWTE